MIIQNLKPKHKKIGFYNKKQKKKYYHLYLSFLLHFVAFLRNLRQLIWKDLLELLIQPQRVSI